MSKPLLLLSGLALAASLTAAPPSAQPSADWIKRTKDRIDILLGPKHDTSAQPANTPNPFRLPGQSDSIHLNEPSPQATDAETLARLVATLKINGLVQIAGVPQVIINQLSYKEGDLVAVREGDKATYLRVIRVTPTGLTLELNKVEQTIHLK